MNRHRLGMVALVGLAGACVSDSGTAPVEPGPSFVISDGAHAQGNPEFFWLTPMVPDPRNSGNWTVGGLNPTLQPTVTICALDLPATALETDVSPNTPCKPGGYSLTIPFSADGVVFHVIASGNDDRDPDNDGHYHAKWTVPVSSDVFFRLRVLVGAKQLGLADLHSFGVGKDIKNVNTGEFVARNDGLNVPIRFRIEKRALCDNPGGTSPCSTTTVNLGAGGTAPLQTDPLFHTSGATFPPQTGAPKTVAVTVQTCPSLNPPEIDLPVFGSCLRINVEPALTVPLNPAATVFVCDYPPDVSSLTHDQAERVTLHRLKNTGGVEAVPHADADCTAPTSSFSTRLGGVVRYLAHGRFKAAGAQLAGLIGPTPLQALDRGGGGLVLGFSDLQFALPSKVEIYAGNGQVGPAGSPLPVDPTVKVTDLGGDAVKNARVNFTGTGTIGASSALTDAQGLAHVSWTIVAGANSLTAGGRGIAGVDPNNGPRTGLDPFQPIQQHFDGPSVTDGPAVVLLTGSQTFTATGVSPASLPFGFLAPNYFYKQVTTGAEPNFYQNGLGPGFSLGNAAFGTANSGCPLNAQVVTAWAANTEILVRKQFTVPTATNVKISVRIDNDVKVYVDGVDITNTVVGGPAIVDGYVIHENCAADDSFVFRQSVSAGVHWISVRGRDRGSQSYLDIKVEVATGD